MSRMSALGDLLTAVLERGARLVDWSGDEDALSALEDLTAQLLSAKGEASGIALAGQVLGRYDRLPPDQRLAFFQHLGAAYNPDAAVVSQAAEAYAAEQTSATLAALFEAVEPPRQDLFRRLNQVPGGTAALVRMRADLLRLVRDHADLACIDQDFRHLLASWFNRGFLVMQPIDWQTPAAILEKIIAYEAVHQIDTWDELRRRVEPPDRRCFAFFHPSMPDEPLIFVEVALLRDVPGSIQAVLAPDRAGVAPEDAKVAAFYSISNCQSGLAGVSFGAFLIKQVAEDLAQALPGLDTFVTLSPVPGLRRWLTQAAAEDPEGPAALALGATDGLEDVDHDAAQTRLLGLTARYFLDAKRSDGQPLDPVARFHLGNGAELSAIHADADTSPKGITQSAGVMVNYHYRLDRVEANHEAYEAERLVAASRAVRVLAKG